MSEGCDFFVSEGGNAMSNRGRLSILMSVLGVFQGLPRMLVSGQVIRLPVLLGNTMGMRGTVSEFGSSLVVLVM